MLDRIDKIRDRLMVVAVFGLFAACLIQHPKETLEALGWTAGFFGALAIADVVLLAFRRWRCWR